MGSSKSTETSTGSTVTYTESELNAGDIRLSTTAGDLSVSGSTLTAAQIALDSARNLLLTSVQDTEVNRTERKNSSWSAGVFAGKSGGSYGFGIEGAGAIGQGRENSDTVTQVNTQITGNRVSLHSAQDTELRGAVVNANKLNADIGGNLTIESRQDSNRYAGKQSQANAGGSIAIYGSGSNAYAGSSMNKGKVNYAQVEEQSGFNVGEGGLDVNVQGNTHLKGGLIQSTAPAANNRFRSGSLSTEDIENRSEISLQSLGGGMSTDMFSGD
ncbi:hemagglutinin repeat-containing protein, partial [Exercitatus varius]|uniref:hemagglutinin repeat-containing protein n=1 Tax=Exercitatus varius TaxID=67857 RepID=UPI00294B6797